MIKPKEWPKRGNSGIGELRASMKEKSLEIVLNFIKEKGTAGTSVIHEHCKYSRKHVHDLCAILEERGLVNSYHKMAGKIRMKYWSYIDEQIRIRH